MNQQQDKQVTMAEVFAVIGDLYFKLQMTQRELQRLAEENKQLKEANKKVST